MTSLEDSARTASGPDAFGTRAAKDDASQLPPAETTSSSPESTAAFAVQGFRLYAILVGICFGAFMMSLDVFVISTVNTIFDSTPKKKKEPPKLTSWLGHPLYHLRVSRHVSAGVVSGRLFVHDMCADAAGREADYRVHPALGVHRLLHHLPGRQHHMRLGPEQRHVYRRPRHRRYWRLRRG